MKYVWIITATREAALDQYETTAWEVFVGDYFECEQHVQAYIDRNLAPSYPDYEFNYIYQRVQE